MAGHFLDLVEKMKIPNGYYWMRDDGTVFYSDIDLTDDPALKETVLQQSNGYNQHNTQFFKFLNSELGSYFDTVREIYPGTDDGGLVRILVQMPGQMIPVHMDTFVTYRKFFNVTSDVIVDRHSIFITPWKWGHFFHYGTSCVSNWKSGDSLIIENGVPHGSANAGYEPKITMQYDIRR